MLRSATVVSVLRAHSDRSLPGVGCASWRRERRTRSASSGGRLRELDPAGQQDRPAEGDVDGEGVGKAGLERRQAARLGPHPVGDRAPGSRAPSRSARACGSGCGRRRRPRSGGRGRRRARHWAVAGELAGSVGSALAVADRRPRRLSPRRSIVLVALPDELLADPCLGDEVERAPARVGLEAGSGGPRSESSSPSADRPVLDDPVVEVDEADRAEREAAVGHHRHVQREGEHVRVGGGQVVAQREAADPGVGGDARRARRATPSRTSSSSGISPPPPGTKGSSEAPGISGAAARA